MIVMIMLYTSIYNNGYDNIYYYSIVDIIGVVSTHRSIRDADMDKSFLIERFRKKVIKHSKKNSHLLSLEQRR